MKKGWLALPLLLLLSGCWDERQLKDAHLAFSLGIDSLKKENVTITVAFPEAGTEAAPATTKQIISGTGTTFWNGAAMIDREIGGGLDLSKLRIMLIGEKTAKEDVYPLLDAMYRNPSSPMNAKLAIVEGEAKTYFHQEVKGEELFSRYYRQLIESGEDRTLIPATNLQLFCSPLFDTASDPFLPLLTYVEENKAVKVSGSALFHGRKMTGKLSPEETAMLLLMRNEKKRELNFTFPLDGEERVTVEVRKAKSDIRVKAPTDAPADVAVTMKTTLSIIEYPPDHLDDEKKVKQMERNIEKAMEQLAERTIVKLQQANSDAIGIGRKMIIKNPRHFEERDWANEYPDITFRVNVKAAVHNNGIIL